MSVKQIGLSGLCWLLCGLGWLNAQAPSALPEGIDTAPLFPQSSANTKSTNPSDQVTSATGSGPLSSAFRPAPAGVNAEGIAIDEGNPPPPPMVPIPLGSPNSPYLVYPHAPCCCGPVGQCGGYLGYDVFLRSGVFFPVGAGVFNHYLTPGWDIEGGARLYMFNPPATAAWIGTLGVSNMYARTGANNQPVTMFNVNVIIPPPPTSAFPTRTIENVPAIQLHVNYLNMTFVNLGFGRQWWLHGSADPGQTHGWNWSVGCDGGGRYGTAKVAFEEIEHKTGVVGGTYAAIFSNVEAPFRCGIPFAGIRLEYNYIWTGLLQRQNPGDFQSLNLLAQLGVRF